MQKLASWDLIMDQLRLLQGPRVSSWARAGKAVAGPQHRPEEPTSDEHV